jgi:membrane-bound lytic murein transglycosylase MltF
MAGIKYMDHLILTYLKDAELDEKNRTLFAFASYNAGPNRIAGIRKKAKALGINPNIWFNSTEHVVARHISQETVKYVRNIYKYYVAYKLATESERDKELALSEEKLKLIKK